VRGPWARSVLAAVAGDVRADADVDELEVEVGRVAARVEGCDVTLTVGRVPPRIWAAMVSYARGRGALEDAVEGRMQSSHLEHLLEEDWGEPLVPRPRAIGRTCTCDDDGECGHVAAVGLAFADAIDGDPGLLLRWRGCGVEALPSGDPWAGGELPEPAPTRTMPVGAVLKRLGPSGIAVGDEDLADVLLEAYEAFAGGPSS
jgi:hypothetical protein